MQATGFPVAVAGKAKSAARRFWEKNLREPWGPAAEFFRRDDQAGWASALHPAGDRGGTKDFKAAAKGGLWQRRPHASPAASDRRCLPR